ncbi:MAG: DinI-like family protein [Pasteurellaceae bacterium]|nr:DinI-like family protein [Pasteurellaceae bacterium]
MKTVDVRFVKESDRKKQQAQEEMMHKLSSRLADRIAEKFNDVRVRVRFSSSSGLDVSGFRDEEKKRFMAHLEEIWDDPFLLDD